MENLDEAAALETALKLIALKDRTGHEIRSALLAKGFAEAQIERVVQRLTTRGMLNDQRLADSYVGRYSGRRGPERLREELSRRGVSSDVVESALEAAPQVGAEQLLVSKFDPEHPGDRARAGRFLIGRGFCEESVSSALDAFFGAAADDSE